MPLPASKIGSARVETGRIVNVNIADWTVDVAVEHGGKHHRDVQVMSPYLHYMNGECVSIMPEVGAVCWLCTPSEGADAVEFVMGFQSVMQGRGDYSGGRPDLNPGDIMMRTRDENFLILRRGGVVQIGATPTSQRMYIPVRNFIRDFAENYELLTFGGSMQWLIGENREENPQGDDKTTFSLLVKEKANDPGHLVDLTIGSHGPDDPTTLSIVSRESGADGAELRVGLLFDKNGNVDWQVQKDWSMAVEGDHITTVSGDLSLDVNGNIHQQSNGDTEHISNGNMLVRGDLDTTIKGGTKVDVDAPFINLGTGKTDNVVLGRALNNFLTKLMGHLDSLICPTATYVGLGPLPIVSANAPAMGKLFGELESHLSHTVKAQE